MPSNADLILAAFAAAQAGAPYPAPSTVHQISRTDAASPPADLPGGAGPRGTSGQQRGDLVVSATRGEGSGITIALNDLAPGSIAEVTELQNGSVILARVVPGGSAVLSPAAADALRSSGNSIAVRVRQAAATPAETAALAAGRVAPTRMAAPQVLLTALRRRLPSSPAAEAPTAPSRPQVRAVGQTPAHAPQWAATPSMRRLAPSRAASPANVKASGWFVQIAALSDLGRANSLARQERGRVISAGGIHRIRLGPFAGQPAAQSARDAAARRGYAGAQIVHVD